MCEQGSFLQLLTVGRYSHRGSEAARERRGRGIMRTQRKDCLKRATIHSSDFIRGYHQNAINPHRWSWDNKYPNLTHLFPLFVLLVPILVISHQRRESKRAFWFGQGLSVFRNKSEARWIENILHITSLLPHSIHYHPFMVEKL